ncbi:adenylate/guanylate cyclase domain-containing protein [Variovorax guangxiensis]|uniref:adenylate/guanylate cyclase domain-containing protein n=1 Tax=Variovorax guangxiensis TaxID=1775474 RepID=UPI0028541EFC|nr:adenylate/guanylate cyclase domain-containing protein [Variovorax guangxiensis]MDR6860657.1 adenylate cyclase [Variovorax guangxiensis]
MDDTGIRQRLAAILVADVSGYSRLMAGDERSTIAALDVGRSVFKAQIESHQGHVIDMAGDSVLAMFETAIGAVTAALEIQKTLNASIGQTPDDHQMRFRIGVHLGDVIEKADGTIYGDGVNIAARLEGLAHPGGLTISGMTQEAVRNRLQATFEDLGEQSVKNIPYPVRAFRVHTDGTGAPPPRTAPPSRRSRSPDAKPSVMLFAFESLGDDAQGQLLATAATEEIGSALAKLTGLSVVTSAEMADYAVRGRVQNAAGRVRATVHLLDQHTTKEFWSQRFDSASTDVFQAIDDLALHASTAVRYEIHARETEMAARHAPEELSDEELLSQAGHILLCSRTADWQRSRELIDRVIARSPDNFMALSIRAAGAMTQIMCGYKEMSAEDAADCRRLAQRAIDLNERSDFSHSILGTFHLYGERDVGSAIREARRSLELNATHIMAMDLLGAAMIFSGDAAAGVAHCLKAVEANPRFPANAWFMQSVALGYFVLQRYDDAVEWAQRADQRERNVPRYLLLLTTAAWHAGQFDLARRAADTLRAGFPEFRLRDLRRWPFQDPDHGSRFCRGLVECGLPE